MELTQGANAPVSGARTNVSFGWRAPAGMEADASAYLLTASGKVRGDHDMVFYNQPEGGDGAIRFSPDGVGRFDVELERVPALIEKIVFCATINEAVARNQTMAMLQDAHIALSGESELRFSPALASARILEQIRHHVLHASHAVHHEADPCVRVSVQPPCIPALKQLRDMLTGGRPHEA